ncbi:magnesium transporter CorA family protein [Flavobacterium sp. SUN046]|uniref:magnesium transporter CorA family protein n=1 Tax=Flavobacterium sp. SUN046 TaxID=3002440 RepID=UPI002DB7D903|nr:magnesium transporter CorA family protein [Flavobacterium sp. SUN046]MEC4050809.1 magnesium transporter CorA family protein [Flavobacterium sp. SUN046]
MRTYFKNNHSGLVVSEQWEQNSWISIENPTTAERQFLLENLQIPESFYNDIEDIDERPRIEVENGWYLIILRIPYKNTDLKLPFTTVPLGVVFKDDIFVSICFYETEMLHDFVFYTQRKNVTIKNNFDLVLKLLLSSSVWFLKYLKQVNQRIKLAEDNLEKSIKNEELQTLLRLEKCLVYFITSIKGNNVLFERIKNLRTEQFDMDLIEDVDIELKQAQEMSKIYSDILSGMMDAYASVISNNLNVVMKRLTSISIILMIPTVIASLYGMNVPNSLEKNPNGLWIIVIISAVLSITGVLLFKKKNFF